MRNRLKPTLQTRCGIAEAAVLGDADLGDVAVTVEQGVVQSVAGPRPVEGLVDAVLEEADREPGGDQNIGPKGCLTVARGWSEAVRRARGSCSLSTEAKVPTLEICFISCSQNV